MTHFYMTQLSQKAPPELPTPIFLSRGIKAVSPQEKVPSLFFIHHSVGF